MRPDELLSYQLYHKNARWDNREVVHMFRDDIQKLNANLGAPSGPVNWGGLGGNITDQSDLVNYVVGYVASQITTADITTANVIYAHTDGDNATGEENLLTKAFADPYAARARAAALGGSWTILVYPGTYVIPGPLLMTNNINFVFLGKGSMTTTSGTALFQDVAGATSIVHAEAWNFTDSGSRYIIRSSSVGSNVIFVGNQLVSTNGNTVWLDNTANLTLVANLVRSNNGYAAVESDTGYTGTFTNYGSTYFYCGAGGGATFQIESGNFNVDCQEIFGYAGCIKTENPLLNHVLSFTAKKIYNGAGDGWAIWMTGASQFQTVRSDLITSTGTCSCVSGSTAIVTIICPDIRNTNVASYGFLHAENSSTLIAIGAVLSPPVGGVGDHIDAETLATVKLIGVVYDVTKVDMDGQILNWNGNSWEPIMECINVGADCTVVNSYAPGSTIDFANFTNCTVDSYDTRNGTLTFTGNGQTLP